MPRVQHPKVLSDRIVVRVQLPDPTVKHVLIVETTIPITPQDARFDEDEFSGLVEAVKAGMDRSNADQAEIIAV